MTEMRDPSRLRDDPSVPADERALLSLEREAQFPYDVTAGAARFRAGLAALGVAAVAGTAAVARSATSPASVASKLAIKALVGLVLPLGGVAIAVMAYRAEHRPAAPPRSAVALETRGATAQGEAPIDAPTDIPRAIPSAVPVDSLPMDPPPSAVGSAGSPARGPSHRGAAGASAPAGIAQHGAKSEHVVLAEDESGTMPSATATAGETQVAKEEAPNAPPERAAPPKPPEPAKPEPAVTSNTVSEMRAIAEARALLPTNPAKALGILSDARKAYPHGYFGEERSALTILALARSGNLSLAQAQAKVFVRVHPKGPFTDEIRAATGLY